MIFDGNRNATLTYNYLNLPKTVTIGGKTLTYDYDAAGIKHKYIADTVTFKYAGAFEYRQIGVANVLDRVALSAGQAVFRKGALKFEYTLKDHLGNVRVVFNELGQILQRTDYYPFGLSINRDGVTAKVQNWVNRYNFLSKETQIGTGYIDLSKRFYDPGIGRFAQIDILAESFPHNGVYNYAENRPIDGIDLDGLEFYRTTAKNGNVIIGAKVKFENSSSANEQRESDIKRDIQSTFNSVINSANSSFKGQIDYSDDATLTIGVVDKGDTQIGGLGGNGVSITTNNDFKDGSVINKTTGQVANTAVHELLHNAGLTHPTDEANDISDTKLKSREVNNIITYSTTSKTASNIFFNIMLYGKFTVDGKIVSDVRGKPENANTITPGQLDLIEKNTVLGFNCFSRV